MNCQAEPVILIHTEVVPFESSAENLESIFDKETGCFSECLGEMKVDMSSLIENIYITDGMKNNNPAIAFKNFGSKIRYEIQKNAIESQVNIDPNYFKQFGCDEKTPASIVSWFSESKEYTLHETDIQTVQIVDYKIHKAIYHSGGISREKRNMISADERKDYNK